MRNYETTEKILMVDVETAPIDRKRGCSGKNALTYDIGVAIVDRYGFIYETRSFVVDNIFHGEYGRMRTCYYKDKLLRYYKDLGLKQRVEKDFFKIREEILELMEEWECTKVGAFNTRFDYEALNNTLQYLGCDDTFFPQDTKYIDVLRMAQSYFKDNEKYINYCKENGYVTKTNKPQHKAEIVYRFITENDDFIEEHTGLADVIIETEIMYYINNKKVKVDREIVFKD